MLKYYIIITLVVFFVFLYSSYKAKKNQKANLRRKIRENWDNELTREYDTDEIEKIASYFTIVQMMAFMLMTLPGMTWIWILYFQRYKKACQYLPYVSLQAQEQS